MKLVVIFDHLGPYHVARLDALALRATVTAIEVAGQSAEYKWAKIDGAVNSSGVRSFRMLQSGCVD